MIEINMVQLIYHVTNESTCATQLMCFEAVMVVLSAIIHSLCKVATTGLTHSIFNICGFDTVFYKIGGCKCKCFIRIVNHNFAHDRYITCLNTHLCTFHIPAQHAFHNHKTILCGMELVPPHLCKFLENILMLNCPIITIICIYLIRNIANKINIPI